MQLCKNRLTLRGTPVALYLFLKNETIDGTFTLENSIPIPDEANRNLTAYKGWIHDNWGTEWILNCKIDSSRLKYGFVTIDYDTEETGICEKAFEILQEKYENRIEFRNHWEDSITKDTIVLQSHGANRGIHKMIGFFTDPSNREIGVAYA